jgi:hypothetical protein
MNIQDQQAEKGSAFNGTVRAIKELYGEEALKKILEAGSPELRELCSRKVLDNEWVPDRVASSLMLTADRLYGRGDLAAIRKIGFLVAHYNLTGIYKIYVKMSSIGGLVKRADQIWKQYFNIGRVQVLLSEEKHFQFEIMDHDPFPEKCTAILGWLDMFIEVYKVKGVATHPECKAKGQRRCVFDIKLE